MSMYFEWGFSSNPFQTKPLQADEKTSNLLMGRDREKRILKNRIKTNAGIVSVEGENGIGKTSLINAAIFELHEESLSNCEPQNFVLPCRKIFQLSNESDLNTFVSSFYLEIAQTLLFYSDILNSEGLLNKVDKWLNSFSITNVEGQIFGFGGGTNTVLNESKGFNESGFKKLIADLLVTTFADTENAGIICILDNLELLRTSDSAIRMMESLRDEVFNIKNVKWIFLGSHGIIRSFVDTPRLSGFIQNPILIKSINSIEAPLILSSRLASFANHVDDNPYCPIVETDFVYLFNKLNGNLRDILRKLSNYCIFTYEENNEMLDFPTEKKANFQKWLKIDLENEMDYIRSIITKQDADVLKVIKEQDETVVTQGMLNGYNLTKEKILNSLEKLEKANLIVISTNQKENVLELADASLVNYFDDILLTPKARFSFDEILDTCA